MAQDSRVEMPKILIATPTFDGRVCNARAIKDACDPHWPYSVVDYLTQKSSLLCLNRNVAWCTAINMRIKSKCTHLAFIDADVEPMVPNWLDFMLVEMYRTGAQVLGAVIPLKEEGPNRETSHAIWRGGWDARRLSVKDILNTPDRAVGTWTEPNLLVSTGLMLIDMRSPALHTVKFTISDQIRWDGEQFVSEVWPEDWNFCAQCHGLGMSIWATYFPIVHWDGGTAYRLE